MRSQAWETCSLSNCLKFIMLLLNWIILAGGFYFPIKASLHLSQESMLFLGKDWSQTLALPLKEKGKKLKFNNITIYFLLLFHITKLNKIIQMQSSSISSTGELFFHNKVQQSMFNFIGSRRSGGCNNRSANKVIVVVTSEVTELGVFKGTH